MENKQLVPGHQLVGIQDFGKRDSIHSTTTLIRIPWAQPSISLTSASVRVGLGLATTLFLLLFCSFLFPPFFLFIHQTINLYPYLFYSIFRKVFIRIKQNCRRFKQSVCKRRTSSPSWFRALYSIYKL